MKKLLLLIIGIVSLLGSVHITHAQGVGSGADIDDCTATLYDNEFSCARKSISSYCSLSEKAGRSGPQFNIYENAYCDLTRDTDDDIYAIVADEFKQQDPKMDKDKIKDILTNQLIPYYVPVKTAYDREKIMYQAQESLKSQFKKSEIWANGSLSDSPFDLIVDLNLIDISLFGSKAVWNDDVWKWPKDKDTSTGDNNTGSGNGQTSGSGGTGTGAAGTGTTGSGTGQNPSPGSGGTDQYECVPNDNPISILTGGSGTSGSSNPTTVTAPTGTIPPSCGNGKKDAGEECDDGNNKSGDGCSYNCTLEIPTDLSCQDTEAVTFKPFVPKSATGSPAGPTIPTVPTTPTVPPSVPEIPIDCPPGSTPTKVTPQSPASGQSTVKQSANYPGPFVGGVLKQFPPVDKTQCAPGSTYVEINVAGKTEGTCIQTKLCADFEVVRKKFFGDDYRNDPSKVKEAEAIEATVCVDVKKVNRPQSPYNVNDGCIDCHILAMDDIMNKMLQQNVAPLENNMQSWGTSNRWGPTVSFNINVLMKRGLVKPIVSPQYTNMSVKDKFDLAQNKALQDSVNGIDANNPPENPTVVTNQDASVQMANDQFLKDQATIGQNQFLKNYRMAEDASANQTANNIIGKLQELDASFAEIQKKYQSLSLGTKFQEKNQCTF
jgi:cysteine-rich repeat protein